MSRPTGIALDLPTAPSRRVRISLTPLIDVVFILLVFFMLASSHIDWRVVSLGTGGSAAASGSPLAPVVLRLSVDGVVYAGDTALAIDGVAAHVQARADGAAPPPAVLVPDPGVDLQAAIRVLDVLRGAGVERVQLMTVGKR